MVTVKNIGKTKEYVYDISLDGTVVNALGGNILSNTDGFNFQMPQEDKFRYTKDNPYISNGAGRNSVKDKAYVGVEADVCEFEDMYFHSAWNGGVNKMGLGIDEFCDSTINFSRKNYADKLENGKTKKVGNTVKSRKMSGFIEKFLDPAIDMLLNGQGQEFLESYYAYIDKIYNYQIPLRDIASKGKIKKTLSQYVEDCKTVTKSGSKKSRQAWYELALQNNLSVNLDDTIYYINCGSKKSESDVKRVTHQFIKGSNGELEELNSKNKKEILLKECEKQGLEYKGMKESQKKLLLKPYIVKEEDEILLNCKLVPREIVEAEDDVFCDEEIEYNVVKYIEQFNKRITPLLVCFSTDIRSKILVNSPEERQYFTKEECELVSGMPNKSTDQDTYEQLMKPERKEIEYWLDINEEPPFIKECGQDWEALIKEYHEIKKEEENALFQEENERYLLALSQLTEDDINAFDDDGVIPKSLDDIVTLDSNLHFKFKRIPHMSPTTGGNIFDDISRDNFEFITRGEEEFENHVESYCN